MNAREASKAVKEGARLICVLEGCHVVQYPDKRTVFSTRSNDINYDGSPRAYHPDNKSGEDFLVNAGRPGKWWALATDNGMPTGTPIVQGTGEPAPGFYVSTTAYMRKGESRLDPRAYLDADAVPFIVIEDYIRRRCKGVVMGCLAKITRAGRIPMPAMVGDVGPLNLIGEGSPGLWRGLGYAITPRMRSGIGDLITYELFPDSQFTFAGETFPLIPAR